MKPAPILGTLTLGAILIVGGCASSGDQAAQQDVMEEVDQKVDVDGNVTVSVVDGVATLSGFVNEDASRQEAEEIAGAMDGVEEVVNLITVEGDLDSTN